MKRFGNLFCKITDLDNIMRAHQKARKGKTNYSAVKRVDKDAEGYCRKIQQMLIDKTFTTSKYHQFQICDSGKLRDINELPYYPDRIVQWATIQVIEPIFNKHFIAHTYAAIPRKGTHRALRKTESMMRQNKDETKYTLKLDAKKYFPSMDKELLKILLRKKIKCKDTLWLLDNIIDSFEPGVPIGSYTSQYFGNFYLSFFDHWMKEVKRVKFYIRYMDDIVIFHHSKEYLHQLRKDIDEWLTETLHLKVKDNWQVFPSFIRGVDFVGYRIFENYTLLRKRTTKKLKAACNRIANKLLRGGGLTDSDKSMLGSYSGILSWGNCRNLRHKTITKIEEIIKNGNQNYKKRTAA